MNSAIRFADVSDGTSNTLLAGERPPSTDLCYGWWYAGEGQNLIVSTDIILGVRELMSETAPIAPGCPLDPTPICPVD